MRRGPACVEVGLSGAGAMGSLHARVLSRLGGECRLTGIYDVDAARARALAASWGVPALGSFESLLERSQAVVVAASTAAHVEQVLACVDAGRHVLVEKPAAPDLQATIALRDHVARVRTPPVVQVGHVEHFNPSVAALQRALGGELPLAISGRRLGPPTLRSDALDVVTDLMLHDIHVVAGLGPGEVSHASAVALAVDGAPTHYAHATLCFTSGMVADLTASRMTQARLRVLEATTADALVTADYVRGTVEISRWTAGEGTVVEHTPVSTQEPLERELLAFLAAIRRGGPAEVDLDVAVHCMRVVDAIRRGSRIPATAGIAAAGLG